jgi:hypothetical protein
MTRTPEQIHVEHAKSLLKQIMVDTHPIFGSYILYIKALSLRVGGDFQGAMDHIRFAMEWIEFWRVTGAPWDLAQKVAPDEVVDEMYLGLQQLMQRIDIERTRGAGDLDRIVPEDWMGEVTSDDVWHR